MGWLWAIPISEICIKNALDLILNLNIEHLECVYPNANGTISFEWEHLSNSLGLEIGKTTIAYYARINGKVIFVGPTEPDKESIKGLVETISLFTRFS